MPGALSPPLHPLPLATTHLQGRGITPPAREEGAELGPQPGLASSGVGVVAVAPGSPGGLLRGAWLWGGWRRCWNPGAPVGGMREPGSRVPVWASSPVIWAPPASPPQKPGDHRAPREPGTAWTAGTSEELASSFRQPSEKKLHQEFSPRQVCSRLRTGGQSRPA